MSKVTFDWFKTFDPVGNPNPSMAVFKSPGFTKSRCEANPIPASSSGVNVGDSISTTSPVSPFLSELVISTLTCNPSVTVTGVPNFIVEVCAGVDGIGVFNNFFVYRDIPEMVDYFA